MAINFKEIENKFQPTEDGKCAVAEKGMVATQSGYATDAGVEILKLGGNAIDAAVASALAVTVTEPQASGIGGQTMMLIYNNKKTIAIDGSSRAPSLAHSNSVYRPDRLLGYRATTVPSTLATLFYVHQKYGTLEWNKVVEPAIQYAEDGYSITYLQKSLQVRELDNFLKVESKSGAKYFLKNNQPYDVGDTFKQPELAELLKKIASKGIIEFYRGKTAKIIDADMRENGGLLRYEDLALIPNPIERDPIKCQFRGLDIRTMPPPGAGRTLVFALLMLDHIPPQSLKEDEKNKLLILIAILRKAFLERSDRPYDPNFFRQITKEQQMLDRRYAHDAVSQIIETVDKNILASIVTEDELSGETTHLSVMDKNGMAVSLTQSIERVYGSKAAADRLGFLYNNYLSDFDYKLPEHPFFLRPNHVPWATVAPTIVLNNGKLWMALGSPGSERIISVLTSFLQHITDRNMSIDAAMKAPRIHCSLGGRVSLETERFMPDLMPLLKQKGYRLDEREAYAFYLGCIQAIVKKHDGNGFQGISDVRRDGTAKGI